jgi:DNA-binding NarL/FixJ family response regulator
MMIEVMVCDDHAMVARALSTVLDADDSISVVAQAVDRASVLEAVASRPIDVAVMDVRLPGDSGLDIAAAVKRIQPECKVVMLTAFPSDVALVKAYELGASAFHLKDESTDGLIQTIKDVVNGLRFIDSNDVYAARQRLAGSGADVLASVDDTDRKILTLLAQGCTNAEISDQVYLSLQTVRNRLSNLLSKFKKRNRTELAITLKALDGEFF